MLRLIELLGIFAFALSGLIEARRKNMDLVGTYAIAFMTALGGGTLRYLLLHGQPLWGDARGVPHNDSCPGRRRAHHAPVPR